MILFAAGTGLYASASLGRGSYEAVTFALAEKNHWQVKIVRMVLDGGLRETQAADYYFYARAYSLLRELLLHLAAVGNTMKNVFYPLYRMGLAAEGSVLSMLIFAAIVLAAAAITYRVLSQSFMKLTTEKRGSGKTIYKDKTVKPVSVQSALLRKELQHFTGSANYMLNCGLGIILMPVSARRTRRIRFSNIECSSISL